MCITAWPEVIIVCFNNLYCITPLKYQVIQLSISYLSALETIPLMKLCLNYTDKGEI